MRHHTDAWTYSMWGAFYCRKLLSFQWESETEIIYNVFTLILTINRYLPMNAESVVKGPRIRHLKRVCSPRCFEQSCLSRLWLHANEAEHIGGNLGTHWVLSGDHQRTMKERWEKNDERKRKWQKESEKEIKSADAAEQKLLLCPYPRRGHTQLTLRHTWWVCTFTHRASAGATVTAYKDCICLS